MSEQKLKIVYFGSGALAKDLLSGILKKIEGKNESSEFETIFPNKNEFTNQFSSNELQNFEFEITATITQPDRILRKKVLINPVAEVAEKNGIKTFKPENFKTETGPELEKILESCDLILTASYGQILPEKILQKAKFGSINWHPSHLPKYRGASPLQQTLLNGDKKTALSWIEMVKKMDAGNIILQTEVKIENSWTIFELSQKMVEQGIKSWKHACILQVKSKLEDFKTLPQNENEVSFCTKINKEDSQIEIKNLSAKEIKNHWRAYLLFPKTSYFSDYFGEIVKIVEAGNILETDELETKILENQKAEFVQIKNANGNLETFLKAKNSYLEIKKICLSTGKNIDFKGFLIK